MTDSAMDPRGAAAAAPAAKKLNPSAKSFVFSAAAPAWTPPTAAPTTPVKAASPAPPAATTPVKPSALKPSAREFVPSVYAAPFVPSYVAAPAPPLPPVPAPASPEKTEQPPSSADEEGAATDSSSSSSSSSSSAAAEPETDAASVEEATTPEPAVEEAATETVEVPVAPPAEIESVAEVEEEEAQTAAVGERIMYTIAQLLAMEPELTPMPASVVGTQVAYDKSQDPSPEASTKSSSSSSSSRKEGRSLHRSNSSYSDGGRGGGGGGRRGGRGGGRGRGPPVELPLEDVAPLQINDETRWKPSHSLKPQADAEAEDASAAALKEAKSILNKLSIEKFDKLSDQLIAVAVTSLSVLTGVIELVIAKAQHEWHFSTMYASLCSKIAQTEMPSLALGEGEDADAMAVDTHKLFRKLLLTKCQQEFEAAPSRDGLELLGEDERNEKELLLKRGVLGHIRFVGELFKQRMLSSRIMHACVQRLFGDVTQPDEESLECLCKLLATIGLKLESEARDAGEQSWVTQYYQVIKQLAGDADKLSTRVRFMLQDLLELRANKWVARRKEAKAMTIAEVHAEAAREEKAKAKAAAAAAGGGGSSRGLHRSNSMSASSPDKRRKEGSGGGGASAAWKARAASADADGWETVNPGAKPKLSKSRSTVTSADRAPRHPTLSRNSSDSTAPVSRNSFSSLSSLHAAGGSRGGGRERSLSSSSSSAPSSSSGARPRTNTDSSARPPRPTPSASAPPSSAPLLSPDAFKLKVKGIVEELVALQDMAEAVACVAELPGTGHAALLVQQALDTGLDKSAAHRAAVGTLLAALHAKALLETDAFHGAVHEQLEFAEDMEIDIPLTLPYLAQMLAPSVASGALALPRLAASVAHLAVSGKAASFVARLLPAQDEARARELAAQVDVAALLREGERTEEALRALYAAHGLGFLLA